MCTSTVHQSILGTRGGLIRTCSERQNLLPDCTIWYAWGNWNDKNQRLTWEFQTAPPLRHGLLLLVTGGRCDGGGGGGGEGGRLCVGVDIARLEVAGRDFRLVIGLRARADRDRHSCNKYHNYTVKVPFLSHSPSSLLCCCCSFNLSHGKHSSIRTGACVDSTRGYE